MRRLLVPFLVSAILHVVPWWRLVLAPGWPSGAVVAATVVAVLLAVGLPAALLLGRSRGIEGVVTAGAVWLGVVWQLFVWTLAGELVRLALVSSGVPDPLRARAVALVVVGWTVVILGWGAYRALGPVPVRERDVHIEGLGAALDGLRVVLITDTHYGPLDRARWSARVAEQVNALDADILAHTGDIADGTRRRSARPGRAARRGDAPATARVYVTGNHEYYCEAQGWVDHMGELGWTVLHNRHVVVERGGDALVRRRRRRPHRASVRRPRARRRPRRRARRRRPRRCRSCCWRTSRSRSPGGRRAGVDLQLSGHTHGGQIWPFHYLVRAGPADARRALPGTARAPSSTPAAAPASGARRSASSPRGRSPC